MVIRIEAGRPGRLTISVEPRIPAVWRDRIAVGTCFKLSEAHQFAKSRHQPRTRGDRGFRCQIARRRSRAARCEYQRAFFAIRQIDQGVAHAFNSIGNETPHGTPRRRHHLAQKLLNRRAAGIAVCSSAGTIGHGHDADRGNFAFIHGGGPAFSRLATIRCAAPPSAAAPILGTRRGQC